MDRDVNQLIDKLEHEINSFKDQLQSLLNATTQMCEAP
jgi:cell division septum initiation protein DivIVA